MKKEKRRLKLYRERERENRNGEVRWNMFIERENFLSWGRSRERKRDKKKAKSLERFWTLGCCVFSPLRKVSPFPCRESFFSSFSKMYGVVFFYDSQVNRIVTHDSFFHKAEPLNKTHLLVLYKKEKRKKNAGLVIVVASTKTELWFKEAEERRSRDSETSNKCFSSPNNNTTTATWIKS